MRAAPLAPLLLAAVLTAGCGSACWVTKDQPAVSVTFAPAPLTAGVVVEHHDAMPNTSGVT